MWGLRGLGFRVLGVLGVFRGFRVQGLGFRGACRDSGVRALGCLGSRFYSA